MNDLGSDRTNPSVRFSIVISNYNYAGFVAEAVASCLAQQYPRDCFEILVVDDGSTDDSVAVLGALEQSAGIRVLTQANQGQAAAFFRGVAEASYEYVCLLDADDVYAPGKLRAVAARIAGLPPGPLFLCHDLRVLDHSSGAVLPRTWFQGLGLTALWNDVTLGTRLSRTYFPFAVPCGQVFERRLLQSVLHALPLSDYRTLADSPIAHAAFLKTGRVLYLHEPLGTYRIHGRNAVGGIRDGVHWPSNAWQAIWPKQAAFLERFAGSLGGSLPERTERFVYIMEQEHAARQLAGLERETAALPLVSFVVESADVSTGLQATVDSVLRQTHARTELLVNGSLVASDTSVGSGQADTGCTTSAEEPEPPLLRSFRRCRGDYVAFLRPGDVLHPFFAERHLQMHQHVALSTVTCSDLRLLDRAGHLVHTGVYRGSGRWSKGIEQLGPFSGPLGCWDGSPLCATLFRRNRLLDAAVSHLCRRQPALARETLAAALQRYAQLLGGYLRFSEPLTTTTDAPVGTAAIAGAGPGGGEADDATQQEEAVALAVWYLICGEWTALSSVFSRDWLRRALAWANTGLPERAHESLARMAAQAGVVVGDAMSLQDAAPGSNKPSDCLGTSQ